MQIDQLEPASGGWVWVHLKSEAVNCADVGPSGNVHLMLTAGNWIKFSDGAFDRIYSTILTAPAANKNVALQISDSNTGQYCVVERVRVKSN